MRQVKFKPSHLTDPADRNWFAKWLLRARRATRSAIADAEAGKPVTFNSDIWSDLKQFLLRRHFRGKCAYCESRVTTTDFGDAEHYRPKAGVTQRHGGKMKTVEYGGKAHPGYYWLAYDWRNLLPACGQCNSGSGKMNQFPIKTGNSHVTSHKIARSPLALDALEVPSLLHPYYHQPEKHLRFGEDGTIAAAPEDTDNMGESSICTYNLWRGDLATTRKEYQEKAWGEFQKAFSNDTPFARAMEKYKNGESPYSLACLHYVKLKFEQRQKEYLSND
jgi:hypothetical protein